MKLIMNETYHSFDLVVFQYSKKRQNLQIFGQAVEYGNYLNLPRTTLIAIRFPESIMFAESF